MSKIEYNLLKYVNNVSKDERAFLYNFKLVFTIKRMCKLLEINRNKYNYLLRTDQLDGEILNLYNPYEYNHCLIKNGENDE